MALDITKSSISLFQPQDRLALLNDIDTFRKDGLANLPQIVVCGDTSSGKSSVLEALSGISFPIDSSLCTRFATEIALRYSSSEEVTGEASISPAPHASESHQHHVKSFKETITSLEDIPAILQRAKSAMGIDEAGRFSRDVLHLKLDGRSLPNLTLVDLPGLIHAPTDTGDVLKVKQLVEYYFKQKESLILTIVSAENPIENQEILTLSRLFDPSGERSIGVITKPDVLQRPEKANTTPQIVQLAQNKHIAFNFKRPWQIMRCLTDDERQKGANRDEIERTLFSQDPWESFDRRRRGTQSLRSVLCEYLQDHILSSLPELIRSLEGKIVSVKSSLQELGPHRATREEHMQYLIRISRRYEQLVKASLSGDYSDSFFDQDEAGKKLRAKTMALTDKFESAMRLRGHMFEVSNFPFTQESSDEPQLISVDDALLKVSKLNEDYRGPELSMLPNPRLVRELFKEQSQKWPQLALNYTTEICDAVRVFLRKVIDSICPFPGHARELLLSEFFQAAVGGHQDKLEETVGDLFKPYTGLFLFCTNSRLQASFKTVQSRYEVWAKPGVAPSGQAPSGLDTVGNASSDDHTHLKVLQLSRAYYNVALETFIDNVVVLGVESCLLSKLEEMFSSETVARMTPEKLQLLAGETPEMIAERTHLKNRQQTLEAALKSCRRHASREFGLDHDREREISQKQVSQSLRSSSPTPRLGTFNGSLTPETTALATRPQSPQQPPISNSSEMPEGLLSTSLKLSSDELRLPVTKDKSGQPDSTGSLRTNHTSLFPSSTRTSSTGIFGTSSSIGTKVPSSFKPSFGAPIASEWAFGTPANSGLALGSFGSAKTSTDVATPSIWSTVVKERKEKENEPVQDHSR